MTSVFTSMGPAEYLQTGLESTAQRLNGLSMLSVVMRDTPSRVPFQHGWSIAYIPLAFVPRLFWPGKPKLFTGQWITDNYGFGPEIISATGATWLGELYFNFGWTAIVVGMALIGLWFRFLQDCFLRIDSTISAMLAGVVTIMSVAPSLGGDLLSPTSGVVFNIAPIVLMHLLISRFTPPPARLPPPL
jgi:hypothetical protein